MVFPAKRHRHLYCPRTATQGRGRRPYTKILEFVCDICGLVRNDSSSKSFSKFLNAYRYNEILAAAQTIEDADRSSDVSRLRFVRQRIEELLPVLPMQRNRTAVASALLALSISIAALQERNRVYWGTQAAFRNTFVRAFKSIGIENDTRRWLDFYDSAVMEALGLTRILEGTSEKRAQTLFLKWGRK